MHRKTIRWDIKAKNFVLPMIFLTIFVGIAITLWLMTDNVFYLFNFTYIGISVAIGTALTAILPKRIKHRGRLVTQFIVVYNRVRWWI